MNVRVGVPEKIRVVYVGDSPESIVNITAHLERDDDDFRLKTVPSGEEVLELLDAETYDQFDADCVVSEYSLHGMDGVELLEKVRSKSEYEVPFILLAEDGSEKIASRAVSAGVTDYFRKDELGGNYGVLADSIREGIEDHREEHRLKIYREMVENVPDGLYALDSDYRFVAVNEGMEELTGFSRDELIGNHPALIVEEQEFQKGKSARERMLENDSEYERYEGILTTKDGEKIPCEGRFGRIKVDGEFWGTAGMTLDISERRERERELERKNERLDDFASIVSHDLRNPLNVAQGNLEIEMRKNGGSNYLSEIEDALGRMERLIDDLLSLAREDRMVEKIDDVSLLSVVKTAWSETGLSDADLDNEIDENLFIKADKGRLCQVFENLFRNAVDHSDGNVTVSVGPLVDSTDVDKPGSGTEREIIHGFYVEDDGPGIPEEELDEIYDQGYSTSQDGTGLGLSIVRSITKAHGWEIRTKESESGGARFEIFDPDFVDVS